MSSSITTLSSLKKAHKELQSALQEARSKLERAGAIHYFEFSYELAWKALREALLYVGKPNLHSPRVIFREAATVALIDDPEVWFGFIEYRNQTVHTYDQAIADEIFASLPFFEQELAALIVRLEKLS